MFYLHMNDILLFIRKSKRMLRLTFLPAKLDTLNDTRERKTNRKTQIHGERNEHNAIEQLGCMLIRKHFIPWFHGERKTTLFSVVP